MDLGLQGKRVLITGGSQGIGRACAQLFAEEGCDLSIVARSPEGLERAANEIKHATGRNVYPLTGDMSVPEDAERTTRSAIEKLGGVDVLVTCAGSSPGGLIEQLTEEQWYSSLGLKFMGYVRSMKAVLPHMRERGSGSIVLVVGNDGIKPSYWETTAGAANAAGINVASSMAEQYGPLGIRVNTVNPGPVNTGRWDGLEKASPATRASVKGMLTIWLFEAFLSGVFVSLRRSPTWSYSWPPIGPRLSTAPTFSLTVPSARESWTHDPKSARLAHEAKQ